KQRENLIQFPYCFEQGQQITIPAFPLGEGLTSILIQSRKPLLLPDQQAVLARTGKVVGREAKCWMGFPLIYSGTVIGAVLIQDLDHEKRFNKEHLNLFNTLAPQIAITVRNTELYTQANEALHAYDQERFLLNTLLEHMPEGVSFKVAQSRYIRTSSSIARSFGLSADGLVGKTDKDLFEESEAEKISREEKRVINSGAADIGQIEQSISSSGIEAWTQTSRIPIFESNGNPYGLLTIQQDITGLKQAEALARRRASQVTTAAEIARDTAGTLDVGSLLQKSVALIRERFDFYHASLFIIDSANEYALLRASAGPAGKQILQPGYRLAVGSKSIVGQVSAGGKALFVDNVALDPNFLPDPLLPETRSELAIPLMIGQRVLGALDVQSAQVNSFQPDDVNVLQILADQLSVALSNAELFARTRDLLVKHRLLRQVTISASSSTNLEDALLNVASGLHSSNTAEQITILLLNEEGMLQVRASAGNKGTHHLEVRIALRQGICGQVALEKRVIRVDDTQSDPRYIYNESMMRSELAIPILFGEEILGVLNLESSQVAVFNENDEEIIGALGSSLGGVIANIRLVNQVQLQIQRERQLYEATSKIRRSVDLETILETSAQEICKVIGARRARIHITAGKSPLDHSMDEDRNNGRNNQLEEQK
ncbi:MAG: GAF domain-containing protein, partial [Anaerolineaceae bacterium]|nr:GAF domain-containing protein [Anaerolineaceae bacterium]